MDEGTVGIEGHIAINQLIIAYTLTGAFVFTVIVTLLALIRPSIVASPMRNALFTMLILEVVGICVGFFGGFITFDRRKVVDEIQQPLQVQLQTALNAAAADARVALGVLAAQREKEPEAASIRLEFPSDRFDEPLFLGFVEIEPKSIFDLNMSTAMKECVYVRYVEGADAVFRTDGGSDLPITAKESRYLVNEKVLIRNDADYKSVCFVAVWGTQVPHK